jgi:hypothetical protein
MAISAPTQESAAERSKDSPSWMRSTISEIILCQTNPSQDYVERHSTVGGGRDASDCLEIKLGVRGREIRSNTVWGTSSGRFSLRSTQNVLRSAGGEASSCCRHSVPCISSLGNLYLPGSPMGLTEERRAALSVSNGGGGLDGRVGLTERLVSA